ncbi:MAG TPA: hypothetical protein VJS92_05030 [Candidatus Polarisedimenticolaceae bacterium]|nr:hypothetical protein [Candidatus Polarisedimenticolaceae bacterium]
MRKLLGVLALAAAAWLGVNYLRTGQLSFFPKLSAADQELHDLEDQLAAVDRQIQQAGRSAGMTGLDTTSDVAVLMTRKEQLEKQIAQARAKQR